MSVPLNNCKSVFSMSYDLSDLLV